MEYEELPPLIIQDDNGNEIANPIYESEE